jgi:enoyl-CoA hydratase/carnithine racemase
MIFTGRNIPAKEALEWGLVDRLVDDHLKEAIEIAKMIDGNSPDAVWASREGVLMAMGDGDVIEVGREWKRKFWAPFLRDGKNLKEGNTSFLERRKPDWSRNWEKRKPKL